MLLETGARLELYDVKCLTPFSFLNKVFGIILEGQVLERNSSIATNFFIRIK